MQNTCSSSGSSSFVITLASATCCVLIYCSVHLHGKCLFTFCTVQRVAGGFSIHKTRANTAFLVYSCVCVTTTYTDARAGRGGDKNGMPSRGTTSDLCDNILVPLNIFLLLIVTRTKVHTKIHTVSKSTCYNYL